MQLCSQKLGDGLCLSQQSLNLNSIAEEPIEGLATQNDANGLHVVQQDSAEVELKCKDEANSENSILQASNDSFNPFKNSDFFDTQKCDFEELQLKLDQADEKPF